MNVIKNGEAKLISLNDFFKVIAGEDIEYRQDDNNGNNCKVWRQNSDSINQPNHYTGSRGMKAIDVLKNFMTEEQLQGFYLGNTLKYILRFQNKNGLEDLKKAQKNLEWLIEKLEGPDSEQNND